MNDNKIIRLANLKRPEKFEMQNRVYSTKGISPTLNTYNDPLFLIVKEI